MEGTLGDCLVHPRRRMEKSQTCVLNWCVYTHKTFIQCSAEFGPFVVRYPCFSAHSELQSVQEPVVPFLTRRPHRRRLHLLVLLQIREQLPDSQVWFLHVRRDTDGAVTNNIVDDLCNADTKHASTSKAADRLARQVSCDVGSMMKKEEKLLTMMPPFLTIRFASMK